MPTTCAGRLSDARPSAESRLRLERNIATMASQSELPYTAEPATKVSTPAAAMGFVGLKRHQVAIPVEQGDAQRPNPLECVATATHLPPIMKSATFPSLRVDPELREAAESVLQEGETLSGLIESSVREAIERRRARAEFIARGLASRDKAKRTGAYIAASTVHTELGKMLAKASKRVRG